MKNIYFTGCNPFSDIRDLDRSFKITRITSYSTFLLTSHSVLKLYNPVRFLGVSRLPDFIPQYFGFGMSLILFDAR
jgi:hypothetical protein